jgi:broad specificity phosphatase PhoE
VFTQPLPSRLAERTPARYFCRHGITDDLEAGTRNKPDARLTEAGCEEMRRAGRLLRSRSIRPALIVCSTLRRAIESAQEIAGEIGYCGEIRRSMLLDERDCGIATGMKNAEIQRLYPDGFDSVPGAEQIEALQKRAGAAVAWLDGLEQDVVVAVGHGVFGRALARHLAGLPHTYESCHDWRRGINLRNGEIMRISPPPAEVIAALSQA